MNNSFRLIGLTASAWIASSTLGASGSLAEPEPAGQNIKYKSGKETNFEELLIQGQLKRPEVSVVTGNTQQGADGLLRLRKDFLDRVATDSGEEL